MISAIKRSEYKMDQKMGKFHYLRKKQRKLGNRFCLVLLV